MTRATITTQMPMYDLVAEVDGEYWRNEPDEKVIDLTLCFIWVPGVDKSGNLRQIDLLQGLDRPARLQIERNLFGSSPEVLEILIQDIEMQGEDLHIESDYDPHEED